MMFSGQTMLGSVGQNAAQHTAQGVASQNVISDVIGSHVGWSCTFDPVP